jgi:hypothetical protein
MLLSLSLWTAVLVVNGLGRVVCSGFCVLLKIVLGCSLLCLCSLAGDGSSWCCCSVHLHYKNQSFCGMGPCTSLVFFIDCLLIVHLIAYLFIYLLQAFLLFIFLLI